MHQHMFRATCTLTACTHKLEQLLPSWYSLALATAPTVLVYEEPPGIDWLGELILLITLQNSLRLPRCCHFIINSKSKFSDLKQQGTSLWSS